MVTLQGAAGVSPAGFSVTRRLILPARCRQHTIQTFALESSHVRIFVAFVLEFLALRLGALLGLPPFSLPQSPQAT
jgi:hypothetical protein